MRYRTFVVVAVMVLAGCGDSRTNSEKLNAACSEHHGVRATVANVDTVICGDGVARDY